MEEYKSDQVEVQLHRHPGCVVEVNISVSPIGCSAAYEQAVKEVRKQVSIPGFRKGKAPDNLIRKQYKDAIERQFEEAVVNTALREGLALTNAYPWQSGSVPPPKVDSCSMEGAQMTFRYESDPQIPEFDPTEITLKKIDPEPVTGAMVDEEIEKTKRSMGAPKPVDNHPVELDDYVRVDIESFEKEEAEKILDNHLIEVKYGEIGAWLIDSLIGKKPDDVYTVTSAADKEASKEFKKSFKPTEYRITVKTVEQLELPSEEEVLKKVGQESMEAWQKTMHERLEQQEKQKAKGLQVEALWKALMDGHPYDLPKTLVEEDKRLEIRRIIDQARRQGVPDDEIRKDEKTIEAQAEGNVQRRFYAFFLSRKILRDLDQLPTDKELTERALQLAQWEAISSGNFAALSKPPQLGSDEMNAYRNQAFLVLTQERAEDYLLEKVKLT